MIKKSEDGLMDYLHNFNKYTPEAITEAVNELKRRGRNFTDEELNDIKIKIQTRTKVERDEEGLLTSNFWKENVVTDPNAPLLYSKGAISAFSLFFSVIFGAVLLSTNVNDTKKKWIVILFGIIYTSMTIVILNLIPRNTFWVLLLNGAGGLGLTTTFWDRYVGKDIKYRSKPIWKPLIISVIISIPFLFAIIYG